MKANVPEFLVEADNVYRTRHFIVKQVISLELSGVENNIVVSFDTYYRRTLQRDLAYVLAFRGKKNIEGKRLPSNVYTRTYVE